MTCPECGEKVVRRGSSFTHLDGEPLCPVVGDSGYEPAKPVKG